MKQHFLHRKGKTLLCMFTIVLLLFNIAIIRIGVASPNQTKAWVDPPSILNQTLVPGENFTIGVNVFNVTNMYGYEIHLYYDTDILDGVSVELPLGHFLTPVDPTKIFIMALEIDDAYSATHGRVLATVLLLAPEPVKNGSGTLITVTFEVTGYGSCFLDLDPAKVGDPYGEPIPHEDVDGYFRNKIPGDIDGDGDVDPFDFSAFRVAYGSKGPPQVPVPEPNYNPEADLDLDGDVDPFDFSTFRVNYGTTL